MTVYQFRIFNAHSDAYPLLGVVSTDEAEVQTAWTGRLSPEQAEDLSNNFQVKLGMRASSPYADQPPTEIMRYNLPYLTSANTEFTDMAAASAAAEQIVAEDLNADEYEAAL